MKNLLKTVLVALAVTFAASCDRNGEAEEAYLPLTVFNVDGVWELAEWNGSPLADGTFAYLRLTRQDRGFTTYDNLSTFGTHVETGFFDIYQEENAIWGYYEYDNTRWWSHKYIVSELTGDRMVWTAEDDFDEVRVYVRIDELPAGVEPDSTSENETTETE